MSKIKATKNNNKISKKNIDRNNCKNNIAFSFNYVTKNKNFKINRFEVKNPKKHIECMKDLTSLMLRMTNRGWRDFYMLDKKQGLETIDINRLKFQPVDLDMNVKKFYSIRFSSGKYRLIGNKRDSCDIFDIWGIDYDFSAYNH